MASPAPTAEAPISTLPQVVSPYRPALLRLGVVLYEVGVAEEVLHGPEACVEVLPGRPAPRGLDLEHRVFPRRNVPGLPGGGRAERDVGRQLYFPSDLHILPVGEVHGLGSRPDGPHLLQEPRESSLSGGSRVPLFPVPVHRDEGVGYPLRPVEHVPRQGFGGPVDDLPPLVGEEGPVVAPLL